MIEDGYVLDKLNNMQLINNINIILSLALVILFSYPAGIIVYNLLDK